MLAYTPKTFSDHYDLLFGLINELNIQTRDIYNIDEMGSNLGPKTDGMVLGPADKTYTTIKGGLNREWVTVVECISATRTHTRPLIIFKG